jgi:hypothetical protein
MVYECTERGRRGHLYSSAERGRLSAGNQAGGCPIIVRSLPGSSLPWADANTVLYSTLLRILKILRLSQLDLSAGPLKDGNIEHLKKRV